MNVPITTREQARNIVEWAWRHRKENDDIAAGYLTEILVDAISSALSDLQRLEPDMFWDPEASEECIGDPYEAVEANEYMEPGDTFRLDCAKRLPSRVYTIVKNGDDIDVRDATPEETAEHEAMERKQKAERKAKMDAENEARRNAIRSMDGGGR